MTDSIVEIMSRHLKQLAKEINSYKSESDIWIKRGEISNSAGNLCLHLCGNLQHFVGSILGDTGYIRKREEEFSQQNVPVAELQKEINKTIESVTATLDSLSDARSKEDYPVEVFGHAMSIEFFLIHLTSHLGYHLGQINYHRRLISS